MVDIQPEMYAITAGSPEKEYSGKDLETPHIYGYNNASEKDLQWNRQAEFHYCRCLDESIRAYYSVIK